MLDLRIIASGVSISPFDLPAMLGRAGAARELGDTIENLIAYLDALGGDIDLEDGGDAEPDDDAQGDVSYTEWHTRGRCKLQGDAEPIMRKPGGWLSQCLEDDEDDDIDEGVEDDVSGFDPEEDLGAEERGEPGSWPEGAQGGGRHFGDDDGEDDGLLNRRSHRNRIRQTSCTIRQSHYVGAPRQYWLNNPRGVRIGRAADILP